MLKSRVPQEPLWHAFFLRSFWECQIQDSISSGAPAAKYQPSPGKTLPRGKTNHRFASGSNVPPIFGKVTGLAPAAEVGRKLRASALYGCLIHGFWVQTFMRSLQLSLTLVKLNDFFVASNAHLYV